MYQPVRSLIRKTTRWEATELSGTEVAEAVHEGLGLAKATARGVNSASAQRASDAGGKLLVDCPDYRYQVLVTNLPLTVCGLEVWRRYNGRAGSENVIRELDQCFALPDISLKKFLRTEAA